MKKPTTYFSFRLLGAALALSIMPAWAQDIVIDSGTDETVISRLPNAGLEENFVCSDATDGTLGKCQNEILGFYSSSAEFQTTEPSNEESANVTCDEGDRALVASYVIGASSDIVVKSIFASSAIPNNCHSTYRTQAGSSFFFRLQCLCLDFPPEH